MTKLLLLLTLFTFNSYAKELVYVIDSEIRFRGPLSQFKCKKGHVSFVPNTQYDNMFHGTLISNFIIKDLNSSQLCLVNLKVWSQTLTDKQTIVAIENALQYLLTQPIGFINISMSGALPSFKEHYFIRRLLKKGFRISLTAGNDGVNLSKNCIAFPACYFTTRTKNIKISSNYEWQANKNGPVTDVDYLRGGTSISTANTTNKWIKTILNRR